MDAATWSALVDDSKEMLRLNDLRDALNVGKAVKRSACLGAAVNLEEDAIQLVFVGFEEEAIRYFQAIRKLALEGYKRGEVYNYSDPSGEGLFAKYMAKRIAATCSWFADGAEGGFLVEALYYLRCAIAAEPESCAEVSVQARLALHLAQIGRWGELSAVLSGFPQQSRNGVWGNLIRALSKVGKGASAHAIEGLESWLLKDGFSGRDGRLLSSKVAGSDVVGAVEVWGRSLARNGPWEVLGEARSRFLSVQT